MAIVTERGKMHNPVTGSGGILTGTIRAVGEDYPDPPPIGARVVPLASLTLTPLKLESVGEIDPGSPHIPVSGTAFLPSPVPWTLYPEGVSFEAALAALDVCNAASQTRELIDDRTRTVLVLGGGHAGLLAMAAARDTLSRGTRVVLIDASERICRRASDLELCDIALQADLRDAVGSLQSLEQAGVPRADLTIVVVNATDCEAASLLLTADHGDVFAGEDDRRIGLQSRSGRLRAGADHPRRAPAGGAGGALSSTALASRRHRPPRKESRGLGEETQQCLVALLRERPTDVVRAVLDRHDPDV